VETVGVHEVARQTLTAEEIVSALSAPGESEGGI